MVSRPSIIKTIQGERKMSVAKLTGLGQEIFERRYAYPGEKNWAERARVIAKTAAGAERDEDKERVEQKIWRGSSSR